MPERLRVFDYLQDKLDLVQVLHWLRRPTTRWAICWILVLGQATFMLVQGWMAFNTHERRDGNLGHTTIDFGGQWLMGRMIVEGKGRQLYHRDALRPVLEKAYPIGDQSPTPMDQGSTSTDKGSSPPDSDAEALMAWLAGTDDAEAPKVLASFLSPLAASNGYETLVVLASAQTAWTEDRIAHVTEPPIGGALYPPIHALYYSPLSLMPPRAAYRVLQCLILAVVFFAGWVGQRITQGNVWWPIASGFIMLFPGFTGCIGLGQNGLFTLTILLVGWWQLMRGREALAGVCWGLLAFKPVWAAAFLLVPVVTGRWRMVASMSATGLAQILVTLPIVGWQSWMNWLQIGRMAAYDYTRQENWIYLSRDLLGLPRRWLLVFEDALARRLIWQSENTPEWENNPLPALVGWGLWTLVLVFTLGVLWRCRQRRKELTGLLPAFVLIGAIFSCYHWMYYDFLVAALPVLLLFTEPWRYFQLKFWRGPRWWRRKDKTSYEPLSPAMQHYYRPTLDNLLPPPLPLLPQGRRPRWVAAPMPPLLLTIMLVVPGVSIIFDPAFRFPPSDAFTLLFLWAWCGYRLLVPKIEHDDAQNALLADGQAVDESRIAAAKLAELSADVGGAHECLADQHGADAGRS